MLGIFRSTTLWFFYGETETQSLITINGQRSVLYRIDRTVEKKWKNLLTFALFNVRLCSNSSSFGKRKKTVFTDMLITYSMKISNKQLICYRVPFFFFCLAAYKNISFFYRFQNGVFLFRRNIMPFPTQTTVTCKMCQFHSIEYFMCMKGTNI